jgi:hypothetical protein
VRELAEEVGLRVRAELKVDGLEIVASHWLSREQALARELPGHVRCYLNQE